MSIIDSISGWIPRFAKRRVSVMKKTDSRRWSTEPRYAVEPYTWVAQPIKIWACWFGLGIITPSAVFFQPLRGFCSFIAVPQPPVIWFKTRSFFTIILVVFLSPLWYRPNLCNYVIHYLAARMRTNSTQFHSTKSNSQFIHEKRQDEKTESFSMLRVQSRSLGVKMVTFENPTSS